MSVFMDKKEETGCHFQLPASAVFPPVNGVQVGLWNPEETSFNTGFILKKTLAEEKETPFDSLRILN
ncbi:hypothetical protein AV530_017350 [Patagioenas fasciata monilis]|uniref:Uncharacterized protein n=1 Tax=Patagioenas fasciata monilis TaxID=372326 RepID=A0A1V4JFR2_PATFA|nr:hypothetical protein AV530_017350 [Patagioenas fasciata monilis]